MNETYHSAVIVVTMRLCATNMTIAPHDAVIINDGCLRPSKSENPELIIDTETHMRDGRQLSPRRAMITEPSALLSTFENDINPGSCVTYDFATWASLSYNQAKFRITLQTSVGSAATSRALPCLIIERSPDVAHAASLLADIAKEKGIMNFRYQ